MLRVVLDTNVVVSACLTPHGAEAAIVELGLVGNFIVCISAQVLAEYREVLARKKFAHRTERVRELLDGIEDVADMVSPSRYPDCGR